VLGLGLVMGLVLGLELGSIYLQFLCHTDLVYVSELIFALKFSCFSSFFNNTDSTRALPSTVKSSYFSCSILAKGAMIVSDIDRPVGVSVKIRVSVGVTVDYKNSN
jgi:hypothetical protein